MTVTNSEDLMMRYLSVCNRAIALNKDRFPFKQILGAAQETGKNRAIEVRVLDSLLQESYAQSYVMTFDQDEIVAKPHGDCPDCKCDAVWKVSKGYLADVADNAETYIENPARINWDWLYDAVQ